MYFARARAARVRCVGAFNSYQELHVPIEDLFLRPAVKKAIIFLLHRANVKVLKDALVYLGPYPTLTSARCSDPGG